MAEKTDHWGPEEKKRKGVCAALQKETTKGHYL